jgi:hypothetical protein
VGVRLLKATVLVLVVLSGIALSATALGVSVVHFGREAQLPLRYRYAGVVENGRGAPAHRIATGDGFRFHFFDASRQGMRSTPYTLCVGRPGQRSGHCWSLRARYGFGRLNVPVLLPADVAIGSLTARWLVRGRTVATWPFLYIRGE